MVLKFFKVKNIVSGLFDPTNAVAINDVWMEFVVWQILSTFSYQFDLLVQDERVV